MGALLLAAVLLPTPPTLAAADGDGDGLYDEDELTVYGTDPWVFDSDGDGASDGEEVYFGTDPLVPDGARARVDSDGDGLYDDDEWNIYGTDAGARDSDGDGAGDGEEVYFGTDPLAPPPTGGAGGSAAPCTYCDNGIGDQTCDACRVAVDGDGDGLTDEDERTYGTDPSRADTDGDTLSDGKEVSVTGTDPLRADSDNDGKLDFCDRDPWVFESGDGPPGSLAGERLGCSSIS